VILVIIRGLLPGIVCSIYCGLAVLTSMNFCFRLYVPVPQCSHVDFTDVQIPPLRFRKINVVLYSKDRDR